MLGKTLGIVGLFALLLVPRQDQSIGTLDRSRAFWYPRFAADPDAVVANTKAGPIHAGTYLRYLAARFGTEYLEDLAFDVLLAKECKTRRLAGSAPSLAKPLATRRLRQSGRTLEDDPDGSMRRKFVNQALRQHRLDAVVGEARANDEELLRAMFHRRYGVGGVRAHVRHILISFDATARRTGLADQKAIETAARAKAEDLVRQLRAGTKFEDALKHSDDRVSRRADGRLEGYNYRRFGDTFAAAVRAAKVGEPVGPVRSSKGFHVLEVTRRVTTERSSVEARLRRILRGITVSPADAERLRGALFRKYEYRPATQ